MSYGHNPIYNPMPFNNQNPYLSKELQRAGNRQGFNNNQGRYPVDGLKWTKEKKRFAREKKIGKYLSFSLHLEFFYFVIPHLCLILSLKISP